MLAPKPLRLLDRNGRSGIWRIDRPARGWEMPRLSDGPRKADTPTTPPLSQIRN